MWNLLQVGLGPLGRRLVEDLAARGLGRAVAACDTDPALAGRPLAELCAGAPEGVRVAPSVEAALEAAPEVDACVVATSSDLARAAPTLRPLLERGLAVASTCEELAWPWLRHPALAHELDSLAREHGGRLVGTGVNPGFLMDALPAFASGACRRIDAVHAWRRQDAAPRRVPFQRKIGAGLDAATFEARAREGSLRHVGLGESLFLVAHSCGLALERWEETVEPVLAERELACELGPIAAGHVAGVRQVATGWGGGRERVRLEFVAAIGLANPGDGVRIEGEPPLDLVLAGGLHGDVATCAVVGNALGPLRAAPPGLHTMATLPLVRFDPGGRADPVAFARAAGA